MANGDDSSSGGLTGNSGNDGGLASGLSGLMKLADPQLLISVGAGLLSGARYGSNAGEGLMQGLQMYQGMKTNQLQRQQMQQQMQMQPLQQQLLQQQVQQGQMGLDWQKALQGARLQALGGNQGAAPPGGFSPQSGGLGGLIGGQPPQMPSQAPPQAAPQAFMPGVSPMPAQGGAPAQQASQPAQTGSPSNYWDVPTPQGVDQATFPGELMPRNLARVSAIGDPKVQDELEKSHYLAAQRNYGSQMNTLKYLAQSANPAPLLAGAPALQSKFGEWAQAAGVDPNSTDPQDLRHVATYAYNQYAGSLGGEPLPVQNALDKQGIDPITGKYEGGEPKAIIRNGQPVNVRPQDAIGQTPYNPSIFGVGNMTDQALENAYQQYLSTGQQPTGYGRNPAMQARMQNYFAQRMSQDGVTPGQVASTGQQFKATQGVVKDFESGATSKTLNGLNTAITHMDQLDQATTALNNGNFQALNKFGNFFKTQFGSDSQTNFNIVKNFASGEVAKAVLPGGGGEREREEIAQAMNSANSPQQLQSAIQMWRNLLAGKTDALRNQWDVGTGGAQGSFDKFLLPATKNALGIGSTPSAQNGQTPAQAPPSASSPRSASAPVRVNSPQEALALKPDTVFMTPDGRLKVR
jgi:hypothetical protein